MDVEGRAGRRLTLQAELEAERQGCLAAEAELAAARAACDELRLRCERAGIALPRGRRRLRRVGALGLAALLAMAAAAAVTVALVYHRRVEGELAGRIAAVEEARQRTERETARQKEDCERRERDLRGELKGCQLRQSIPDAQTLLESAVAAYREGRPRQCMALARRVLDGDPGEPAAMRLYGACACASRDRSEAAWAAERLEPDDQARLRRACAQAGVSVDAVRGRSR